jgi:hypothetical protein
MALAVTQRVSRLSHLNWPFWPHNGASEAFLEVLVADSCTPLFFRKTCQEVLRPGPTSGPLFPIAAHSGIL